MQKSYYYFFGRDTKKQWIDYQDFTKDCQAAVQHYLEGSGIPLYFSEPGYTWMKLRTTRVKGWSIKEEIVHYSAVRDDFESRLFPQGTCSSNYCDTVHDSLKRLTLEEKLT